MKVLINHVGYSVNDPKKAVVQWEMGDKPKRFCIKDKQDKEILSGELLHHGAVANWKTGEYWTADFSDIRDEGVYTLEVIDTAGKTRAETFEVSKKLLTMRMLSATGYYFKAQRASGEWLHSDRTLGFAGEREGCVDAHGGWYDATGDYGIHLSHLSHSTYHNPQQVPFSAYTFFKAHQRMTESGNEQYTMVKRRMLDEGFWGADFLMRMQAPSGSFFITIKRVGALEAVANTRKIGFEYHGSSSQFSAKAATADEEIVTDANYETSLRSGGGLAIAALAIAGRNYYPGTDYTQAQYVQAAKRAWKHLEKNNEQYTNNGQWNLLDEYCALMATTELYITTAEYEYLQKAREMALRVYERMVATGEGCARLETVPGLPFHHASDEGMPVVALLQYAQIEPDAALRADAVSAAEKLMRHKCAITDAQANPFGYPILENSENGKIRAQFFFPHTSTAAPWWQGDNARIASLSAAARMVAAVTEDAQLAARCTKMAQDSLDWIMGMNPFDSCMIEGYGKNNIQYFFNERLDFLNCPGGIVNGITSGMEDEDGIAFVMEPDGQIIDNWRWAEQWIPHVSWYMYAMALKGE